MTSYSVQCYIYDLSMEMARNLSMGLLGKQIDGIWHTGIVVYGKEFFFGDGSITSCPPGGTIMGPPHQVENLGSTEVPKEIFMDYLHELALTTYRGDQYHLLHHNCNTFSNEVAIFLTGKGIPSHITSLPQEFLNTPFGQLVKPFIDSMSVNPGGHSHPVFSQRELDQSSPAASATGAAASTAKHESKSSPKKEAAKESPLKTEDARKPLAPVAYQADISTFILNKEKLKTSVSEADFSLLEEIQEYLTTHECDWSPSRPHILVIDKILHSSSIEDVLRASVCSLLQQLLLRDDLVPMFRMDPQSRKVLLKLLQATKFYTPVMQEVAIKSICNIMQVEGFRQDLAQTSSDAVCIQALSDVCTACVLSEPGDRVNNLAAVLLYSLTLCKITEEEAINIGSALIQHLTTSPNTDTAIYSLYALRNCMNINPEVSSFAAVMEFDLENICLNDLQLEDIKREIRDNLPLYKC